MVFKVLVLEYEIKIWREFFFDFVEMMEFFGSVIWLILGIFGFVVVLGVLNIVVMFMYERMWEFGVLKVIGMKFL